MAQPLVSIIVPVYNTEKYLCRCIESLITQTLENIEIICVDDGSVDGSGRLLDCFALKDARIRVIHKENGGYGMAMNRGLSAAQGKYIGIIESDDFAESDMYETLSTAAVTHHAEIVKSNYYEYRGSHKEQRTLKENLKGLPYEQIISPVGYPHIFYATPSIWSGIYKRSFLKEHNIQFLETPGASYQDKSFAFKAMACASRLFLLSGAYMDYRVDNDSSSVNSPGKVFCVCDVMADCEKFLSGNERAGETLVYILENMRLQAYLWNYGRIGAEYQYAFLLRIREELLKAETSGRLDREYISQDYYEIAETIMHDMEHYYRATSKAERMRKKGEAIKDNMETYREWFCRELEEAEQVVIYGTGKVGKELYEKLQELPAACKRILFAVTDKKKSNAGRGDTEVVEIAELARSAEKCLVVVAVRDEFRKEIAETLRAFSFPKVIYLDAVLQAALED